MEPYICRNVDVSNSHMGKDWIYVGLDLGERVWVAGALDLRTGGYTSCRFSGDQLWSECLDWLVTLKEPEGCQVHVLYEAGRQGFELARQLHELGIGAGIVAVSRLDKPRGRKRGKSDRKDAKALTYMDWTDPKFPLVWIPSRSQEAMRNLLAWDRRVTRSLTQCRNRGLSILARWGVGYRKRMSLTSYKQLVEEIPEAVIGHIDQQRLDGLLKEEEFLRKERERLSCVLDLHLAEDPAVAKLTVWRGIGVKIASSLAWYVADWHRFPNGKSFAAYCGLTPVHERSGSSGRDKGISRAGHPILRAVMGQLAILWLRWQPQSQLSLTALERIGKGKSKVKRIVLTALSRQLAAALWEWMVHDQPIEGAVDKKKG